MNAEKSAGEAGEEGANAEEEGEQGAGNYPAEDKQYSDNGKGKECPDEDEIDFHGLAFQWRGLSRVVVLGKSLNAISGEVNGKIIGFLKLLGFQVGTRKTIGRYRLASR